MFDLVVVGAGFAGAVLAERFANELDLKVLVIERRDHLGGNAHDRFDEAGILVHSYGPHVFHTNSSRVVDYLSRFTRWRPYEHRVRTSVDGQLLPWPINLETINRLYGLGLSSAELELWLAERVIVRPQLRTSEDIVLARVGRDLYERFFRGYTRKQWGLEPSELDASVAGRIPVRVDSEDRYFTDRFQAMPRDGYSALFRTMLSSPNITLVLGRDYRDLLSRISWRRMIYTGPIDEFFAHRFGSLPYRSLEFRFVTLNQGRFQEVATINYPNEHDYTRITEFKHITGQRHPRTSLVYEYPCSSGEPYYPVPRTENRALYARYAEAAEREARVRFVGRLASYRYLNMDQVVAEALHVFDQLKLELKEHS